MVEKVTCTWFCGDILCKGVLGREGFNNDHDEDTEIPFSLINRYVMTMYKEKQRKKKKENIFFLGCPFTFGK